MSEKYEHFGKFVIRTPLLSYSGLHVDTDDHSINEILVDKIKKNNYFSEAIYLASPQFHCEVDKLLKGALPNNKEKEKALCGILRYYSRMSTRCTPFGMFAGVAVGDISNSIAIIPKRVNEHHLCVRLDMNYLCALAKDIASLDFVKNRVLYYPNNSAYIVGDKLRYVECTFTKASRIHHISAVDFSFYLDRIMKAAASGITICDLSSSICDDEVSDEEVKNFIYDIIDAQLLVSEIEPTVSGDNPLSHIICKLEKYSDDERISGIVKMLVEIDADLKLMGKTSIPHKTSDYEKVKNKLDILKTKYDDKYLFQADLSLKMEKCELNGAICDDVLDVVSFLCRVNPYGDNNNLARFREAFYNRYEDQEIPLAQVLDTESGIGYLQNTYYGVTPFVDDIVIPGKTSNSYNVSISAYDKVLYDKFIVATKNNDRIIELCDSDFDKINNTTELPNTISAFIQLLDDKHFYMKSLGGSSAANLLGRFCHVDDEIYKLSKDIIEKDECGDDCIYAEIVHLPESRIGNILHRPELRKYEIPYLAQSQLSVDRQIPLDDLMVSVRGDEVRLRSKKYNKKVIPRLTTAHNYSFNSLPVYHFLCDMQCHGKSSGAGFYWGFLEDLSRYLPRVIYKNVILSLQTWRFDKDDVDCIIKNKKENERLGVLHDLLTKYAVVDEVVLEDGDNELYLNLKDDMYLKILIDLIKNRGGFTLKEFLFSETGFVVKNDAGGFTNEIIIPFYKKGGMV